MKALLVDDELKLGPNDIYNGEAYPKKDAIYIVDDGVTYILVVVTFQIETNTNLLININIPRKVIVKEYEKIGEQGVNLLQKQLSELNYLLKHISGDCEDILSTINTKEIKDTGSVINLDGLTKLIAVAQKPELIDKKVN